MLGILAAYADLSAVGLLALLVQYKDPTASGDAVEGALGDDDGLFGLAQLQVHVETLSGAQVIGAFAGEDKLGAEAALAHLGEHLAQPHAVALAALLKGGGQSARYAVYVMLVHHGAHLEVAQVVHHANLSAGCHALAQLHVQQSHLAVDLRPHLQAFLPLAHQFHVALHGGQVVRHLFHLALSQQRVLVQAFLYQLVLLVGQLIVFLGPQPVFLWDEAFGVELLLALPVAALRHHVLRELQLLVAVVQTVLLHGNLRVAQHVLLLRQLAFGIQNLQVQVGVAQANQHVALLYRGAFLHHTFLHDTAFLGADLYHLYGCHMAVQRNVVVELALDDGTDAERLALHLQHGGVAARGKPCQQAQEHCASHRPRPVLGGDEEFLFFNLSVHMLRYIFVRFRNRRPRGAAWQA